jgi:transposase, IS5 family
VIPWREFYRLIAPHAPKVIPCEEGGRPAHPVSVLLRLYFCQNWYQLSDEGAEDALYDIESVRRFCLGSASLDGIPAASTIRRFRHLLEAHGLQEKLFAKVTQSLSEKGIVTRTGTRSLTPRSFMRLLRPLANLYKLPYDPRLLRA